MNATYECVQTLDKDLITGATCRETLQLRGTGIQVVNQMTLRFERQLSSSGLSRPSMTSMVRSGNHLLMSSRFNSQPKQDLIQVLRQICQQLESESQIERTVESFPELVESLKNSQQLERISKSLQKQEICSSNQLFDLFLDASALSGTPQAIQVLIDVYQSGRVSKTRSNYLFSLLSMVSEPKEESIQSLIPLLKNSQTPKHVVLGISGYVHNLKAYTSGQRSVQQWADQSLDALLERMSSQQKDSEIVGTLKAIENIGVEGHQRARQQLIRLAKDQNKSDYVRSAAIRALSEAMDNEERQQLLEVFKRSQESNEIRINAYKAVVMSSATRRQLQDIKDQIQKENNRHIQQYVRSHQKNLRESSDPHKQHILPSDAPSFDEPSKQWFGISNNFETSFMFDALSVGVSAEGDVIQANEGSFPRSVTANLTLPLFGREIQLIEVEFRQKGFENVLNQKLREIQRKSSENLFKHLISEAMDVVYKADQWSNQVHSRDLQMQVHLKFDGKTVLSMDLSDIKSSDNYQIWNHFRQQLRDRLDIDRAFAVQPVNTRIQLPTTSGFPVFVRLNATLVSTLKTSIKVSDSSSDQKIFDAMIAPSVGLQVEAGVEFMAKNQKKSVEWVSKLSSSPVWDSKTEIRDKRIANLKINIPKESQTLVRAESRVYERDSQGYRKEILKSPLNQWFGNSAQKKICSQTAKKALGLYLIQ